MIRTIAFIVSLVLMIGLLLIAVDITHAQSAQSCIQTPCSLALNFSVDMEGQTDTRWGTWGKAQAQPWRVTFRPPAGYRVHLLRVYGDLTAFPQSGTIGRGTYAQVILGLLTTAPGGSIHADNAADDCFLWYQGYVDATNAYARLPFDCVVEAGGLLEPDNVMIVQVAVSLNTTGLAIHEEPTLVAVYKFEKES